MKNHISGGSHFELSNMAAPLRIGFGSRKIWTEHIKDYQCNNFHAFVQICTFPHEHPPNSLDYIGMHESLTLLLDDAVASCPRIKRDATGRSLEYSDYGQFLATPEKRKKSRIDQILTSACCPRHYEHIDIKRVAYNHVTAILPKRPKHVS